MTHDVEDLLAFDLPVLGGGDSGIQLIALGLSGRRDEARRRLSTMSEEVELPVFQVWARFLTAWLDRRPDDMRMNATELASLKIQEDPEAIFLEGWLLCDAGAGDAGTEHLRQAVAKGYYPASTLARSRQFDALRETAAFQAIQADADAGQERALAAFRDSGGERLLGRREAPSKA
jgi:hypothetical protein